MAPDRGRPSEARFEVGRIDLTSDFDRNAGANDETTQFISDALVNNPVLGLSSNGFGLVADFDPKKSLSFKVGYQQSNPETGTSLHDSAFTLAEVGYTVQIGNLGEGHYRLWGRSDNSGGSGSATLMASASIRRFLQRSRCSRRYGDGEVADIPGEEYFYSGGVQFGAPHTIHPNDFWGVGVSHTDFELGPSEKLAEGYYNLYLTGHLRASFMLQYVLESATGEGYLLPGARVQVVF